MDSKLYFNSQYYLMKGGILHPYVYRVDGNGHETRFFLTKDDFLNLKYIDREYDDLRIFNEEAAKLWKMYVREQKAEAVSPRNLRLY